MTFSVYIALQIVLLALWASSAAPSTKTTLATVSLTIAGFILFANLSYLEHTRSLRPSTPITIYLGISILLDLARVRTLFFIPGSQSVAKVNLASFCVKLIIFLLELTEKRRLLLPAWQDASPEAVGSVYNRVLFWWLNSLFMKGFRNLISINSLPVLDTELLKTANPTELVEKWNRVDASKKNALLWTFLLHYKWDLLAGVVPRLACIGFTFAQPFLLERVLDFTAEPVESSRKEFAYGLIGAYAIVYIGKAATFTAYQHKTYRLLTMFRGSLISLIFSKTLRMSATKISDAEAITLMSADIDRIALSLELVHEFYSSFIEIALSMWLLYRLLGVAMAAATAHVVGIPIAAAAGNANVPWLEAIERRLAVTTKMLGSMKAIKMTGLTNVMSNVISSLRSLEIGASRRHRIFTVLEAVTSYTSDAFSSVWGFGVFILLARSNNTTTLTEGIAFSALSLFSLQVQPLTFILNGFEDIQTIINSFNRIQEHLASEEREDPRDTPETRKNLERDSSSETSLGFGEPKAVPLGSVSALGDTNAAIVIKDATTGYSAESSILNGINLEISRGKTTVVVGPVGCGKSTLLRLILGEMPVTSGTVSTSFSRAAFCPQSPWITWGTIQNNIIGMSRWDKPWYNTVVKACALSADFEQLRDGDQTNVGTRGSRLSGGQQMRLSLARALYSRNQVMVLDDVLTGLDRATEASILDAVFGPSGLLRSSQTTVVLTTNSINHVQYADYIVILNKDGTVAEQGTRDSLSTSVGYIERLSGIVQGTTVRPEFELAEETLQELGLPDEDEEQDVTSRGTSDWRIYAYFIHIAGKWTFLLYLFGCACFIFGLNFPSIWLQWWTNANAKTPNDKIGYWLGIYGLLGALAVLGCFASDWIFNIILLPKISRKFHELLLATTMKQVLPFTCLLLFNFLTSLLSAPTSFLTSTDAGQIANRFSQDLQLVDNDLAHALDQTVVQLFTVVISAVLVFTGSGYLAATVPVCIFFVYMIQFYYLRTSRQLRIIDIEAKAPLFSQFLETLAGVSCIRAYGWTDNYLQRNYHVLNTSQRPYYLLWCIQRWLNLVLDLMVGGIAVILVAFATATAGGKTGYLGVALFGIINFSGTLQTLIAQWTQLETALGAISRIRSYVSNTPSENQGANTRHPPEGWPLSGTIEFSNVSASYQSSQEPVLKDVNLSINAGEKVAICGRTGSGKTSLISTLLRLLELDTGSVTIDGVDISTIPRQEVRLRLNTLPQEPFFLQASIRDNVDLLHLSDDDSIIAALRSVNLWQMLEERGGLDEMISEELLSHGQRQLFCLARAIVKPSSIVIIDEATSSVNSDEEEIMERFLQDDFRGRTIIAVAHKLHTVLDFDRVVLMDKGHILENGNPRELLANSESAFHSLYMSLSTVSEKKQGQ
ncbi:ABC multidrug transporter B [Metarhizium brunneum]|uniref:ABC multidrug transporter B n=1 Tax=Metarhizium brunneum TaxID=500148 RepID=A0A7D5ZBI0_9HYPO|nr:ABC multidrug transporter B [Metarhizium brunneum]